MMLRIEEHTVTCVYHPRTHARTHMCTHTHTHTHTHTIQKTDMCSHAVAALAESKVRRVQLVGRRGPLQVAFTIKELREMTRLPGCITHLNPLDLDPVRPYIAGV